MEFLYENLHVVQIGHGEDRLIAFLPHVAGIEKEFVLVDAVCRVCYERAEVLEAAFELAESVVGENPYAGTGAHGVTCKAQVLTFQEENHRARSVTGNLYAAKCETAKLYRVTVVDDSCACLGETAIVDEIVCRKKVIFLRESIQHTGVVTVVVGDGYETLFAAGNCIEDFLKGLVGVRSPAYLVGKVYEKGFVFAAYNIHVGTVVHAYAAVGTYAHTGRFGAVAVFNVPYIVYDGCYSIGTHLCELSVNGVSIRVAGSKQRSGCCGDDRGENAFV